MEEGDRLLASAVEAALRIVSGPARGTSVPLVPGTALEFGRGDSVSVRVAQDSQMSRRHFSVRATHEGTFELRDLGSANGTHVNGRRVSVISLRAGDRIDAGGSTFVVVALSKSRAEEPVLGASRAASSAAPSPAAQGDRAGESAETPEFNMLNESPFPVATVMSEDGAGQGRLTVIVKATFTIERDGSTRPAERQCEILRSDEHYDGDVLRSVRFEADTAPFKPRADVVLVGAAYAPRGRPAPAVGVRLRVGSSDWSVAVFGDREWRMSGLSAARPEITPPEPFTRMELTYERAFGGIDGASSAYWPYNLVGTGFIGRLSRESVHGRRLPNLEDPNNCIRDWSTRPKPMGFGYFGRGWLPRLKYAGTYDEQHRQADVAGVPRDFSERLFNGAHPDLQLDDYLTGDETVDLINLTPSGELSFRLPGVRPSVSVRRTGPDALGSVHGQLPFTPNLDTLCIVPDERLLYVIFRAVCPFRPRGSLRIPEVAVRL